MSNNECIVVGPMATTLRVSRIYGMAPVNLVPLYQAHTCLSSPNGYRALASRKFSIYSRIFVVLYSK